MNSLVKELIRPLLEDNQKVTAVYGGGFKPPIKGHFNLVKQSLKDFPEIDQFIVNVGSGVRNGISQEQAMEIWDVYQEVLGPKVHIQPSPSGQPIKDVRRYAKDHPEELVYFIIGYREGREDDIQDIAARTKGVEEKYPNLKVKVISTSDPEVSGTNARKAASKGDKEKFMTYLPDEIPPGEKEEIYNIVDKAILKEHMAHTNTIDIVEKCAQLSNHMIQKGYKITPLPGLKVIDSDVDNSQNFFGTTAYYDPNEQLIVLYTQGRHPKDIVRSYAHEMIHHIQNLEDRLGSITTTNTTEDDHLDSIEREAYEEGNIAFRNWTDSLNKNLNEIGDSSVEPYEWKLQYNGEDSVRYTFFTGYPKIPDNKYEVTYMQTLGEPGNWFGAFRKVEGKYTDVTNEGNIFKIMSTVLKTFKDFLEKRKPLSIEFDPTKNDKDATGSNRRAKLYASYIGKSLPSDYTYTTAADDSILVYQKDYFPKDFGQILREKKSKDPFGLKAYAYELARLDEGYKVKVYNKHDKKDFFFLSDKNPFKPLEFNSGEEAREAIETQFDLKGKPHKLFDFYIVDNNNKEFPYPSPLRIVREEDTPQLTGKPTIFCDMDGVLVDFDKGYKNLTGMSTQHVNAQGKKDFWKAFRQGLVNKDISEESYWANLDWQPGGKELWDYISKYNPYVLTAPAVNFDFPEELRYSREHNESIKGKLDWVQRLPNMRKIYFAAAKNKAKFAGPNKILIDDRQDTIDAWNANGGIGILYKSPQQVIKDLEKLGL